MELKSLLPVLRRWALVMVAATAVAALIGVAFSLTAEKTYESQVVILVGPLNTDNGTMRAAASLSQTYAELATSDSLLERAANSTGVPEEDLTDGVRATASGVTRFLTLRARADNPEAAKDVANAVANDLLTLSQAGSARPEGLLQVIDPASTPQNPVSPRGDLVIPLAALAGLLGSAAVVLVFEFLSDTAESAGKVGEAAGVTTLAIPRPRARRFGVGQKGPDPLRVIATQVELGSPDMRCVLVTSGADDDGTAVLALDLARIWGERRAEVTVIDATGPTLRLWDEPATPDAPASASVTEESADELVDRLTGDGGLVVVLTPSPVTSTATLVWAHVADVTLLGVRRFQTRRAQVRDAASNLRASGANMTFALLHDGSRPAQDAPSSDSNSEEDSDSGSEEDSDSDGETRAGSSTVTPEPSYPADRRQPTGVARVAPQ